MDAKLFKAFTPFVNFAPGAPGRDVLDLKRSKFEDMQSVDPNPTSWSSMGFIPVQGDEWVIDVQGAAMLCCVQINERNLPGAVQREKMRERIADIQAREERKVTKKEFAQIRDEVIIELLPKAFIRRKVVPVMTIGNKLFLFSPSAKVCDDVAALLTAAVGSDKKLDMRLVQNHVQNNIDGMLTTLAKNGTTDMGEGDPYLAISNVGTLKGPNKQQIAVKDKDIGSHDVQSLLKQDYTIVKLGLEYFEEGAVDAAAGFTVNDKLVFTQFKHVLSQSVRGKEEKDQADTFFATAWATSQAVRHVLDLVIAELGGIVYPEAPETIEDPDEL